MLKPHRERYPVRAARYTVQQTGEMFAKGAARTRLGTGRGMSLVFAYYHVLFFPLPF